MQVAFKGGHSFDCKRLLSVDQYCWAYEQGRTAAYAAIKRGKLRSFKRGRRRLIPLDWAEEYHRNLSADAVVVNPTAEAVDGDRAGEPR